MAVINDTFYYSFIQNKNGAHVTRGRGDSEAEVTGAEVSGAEVLGPR